MARWSAARAIACAAACLGLAAGGNSLAGSAPPGPAAAEVDLASSSLGGTIERITGEYGPGPDGNRLIDGKTDVPWKASDPKFPLEIVLSFFNRQHALVSSMRLAPSGNPGSAPNEVEVWTSLEGPDKGFRKAAAAKLVDKPAEQVISFSPVSAAYLKIRILSTFKGAPAELTEIKVLEGRRAGYTPLQARNPQMAVWSRSPRHAAQLGIDWLEPTAIAWQRRQNCYGCHNQAQVVMGLAVAQRNRYVVSEDCLSALVSFTAKTQHDDGSFHSGQYVTATQFAAMAFAYSDDLTGTKTPALTKAADYLLGKQRESGEVPSDHDEPPIDQGSLMTTANAAIAFQQAFRETGTAEYRGAADKALAWIMMARPATTQDEVFQILALARFGSPERRQVVNAVVEALKKEQNADGGWQEARDSKGSNGYATGQVLYAFKAAGISVDSQEFRRGVDYLISTQKENGAWPSINSHSGRPSEFAPTMWAVIGLAGSFRESRTGSIQLVSQIDVPASQKESKNILIILDCSGSMKLPLEKSTRIGTARRVLREVLDKIPGDFNVGLRFYAHRYGFKTAETCTDTELVLPVAPLDRAKILAAVEKVQPRGNTPLVYSTLQAPSDLKAVGGGSVILITDGEETCGGDPTAAAKQLKASGTEIKLDIVGFTLKGREVEGQLTRFAEATGGHYFRAADGEALARSLSIATARYPFAVFDATGRVVARGEADGPPIELKPGEYRVVVYAGSQELTAQSVRVAASRDAVVKVVGKLGRFSLER